LDKQILLGGEIYRRDYNSFNFVGGERNRTYSQIQTGIGTRLGFPITEFVNFGTRYSFVVDKITLNKNTFYTDPDGATGPLEPQCDPRLAGQYLCDEIGSRVTSAVGYSILHDDTDGIRPTRGQRISLSQDFAGLGGDVKYLRSRGSATKYMEIMDGWVASAHGEGGYIKALTDSPGPGRDAIRITDRFFGPQMRGFDIRGIGPRVIRTPYNADGTLSDEGDRASDALGGRAYYMGRLELEFPVSSGIRSMGLRPSAFVDVGSVWSLTKPQLTDIVQFGTPKTAGGANCVQNLGDDDPTNDVPCDPLLFNISPGIKETFLGNSAKPRLAIGVGVNWVSPFGPFRIDIAKALLSQEGDDTKLFSFNVGTQF
jgi:outer membrane protein insertion porin family